MLFKCVKLPSACLVPGSCVLNVTFGCCFVNYSHYSFQTQTLKSRIAKL